MNTTVICPGCGRVLDLSPTVQTVVCPYCDEVLENEYYNEEATDEQGPVFGDVCLRALVERFDRLAEIDAEALSFGNPIKTELGEEEKELLTEAGLDPDKEDIFLLWLNEGSFFALGAGGMTYTDLDGVSGLLKWEELSAMTPKFYDGNGVVAVDDAGFACGEAGEAICGFLGELFSSLGKCWERALYTEYGMERYAVDLMDRMMNKVEYDPVNYGGINAGLMSDSERKPLDEVFAAEEGDSVCFYYNTNPLRFGKEGFALCTRGLCLRTGQTEQKMSWADFVRTEIVYKKPVILGLIGTCKLNIGEISLAFTGVNRPLARFVQKLQARIRDAMGDEAVQDA